MAYFIRGKLDFHYEEALSFMLPLLTQIFWRGFGMGHRQIPIAQ
jgi:hypothetical protein